LLQLRVDIFIPLYYNPDENGHRKEIDDEKYVDTIDELFLQFGGYSSNPEPIDGEWVSTQTGRRVSDKLKHIWIVCDDTQENVDFLAHLKETLMERFQQEEILMFHAPVSRF
jgi:hypothetical protein